MTFLLLHLLTGKECILYFFLIFFILLNKFLFYFSYLCMLCNKNKTFRTMKKNPSLYVLEINVLAKEK